MKRIVLVVLLLLLVASSAMAATWQEGRSASKPYAGAPEVNLNRTMGYFITYPRAKVPAQYFCDSLMLYYPREDLTYGQGMLRLMEGAREVLAIDMSDERLVQIRPMSEAELDAFLWGGGTCVSIHLPISLELGKTYGVEMDQGCIGVVRSQVVSPPIHGIEQWAPSCEGEYGVSGLYFMGGEYVDEQGILQPAPLRDWPNTGDTVHFTVVLSGDAKAAVIYDPANALSFPQLEYTKTTEVTGTVNAPVGDWGVLFLDENGEVLAMVELNPIGEAEQ